MLQRGMQEHLNSDNIYCRKGVPPPRIPRARPGRPRACMRRINNTSVWTRVFCWALSLLAQPRCCKAALREHHVHPMGHDCNMQCFVMQPFNAFMQTTVAWQRALRANCITLSRTFSTRTLFLGFFLPMEESGSPQILILPIAESSVVHKILLKLFQRISIDFLWKI